MPTCTHALLFKETIFPYLVDQVTRISLQDQLWNILEVVVIFLGNICY